MSYRVVFLTTWCVRVNWTPSPVWAQETQKEMETSLKYLCDMSISKTQSVLPQKQLTVRAGVSKVSIVTAKSAIILEILLDPRWWCLADQTEEVVGCHNPGTFGNHSIRSSNQIVVHLLYYEQSCIISYILVLQTRRKDAMERKRTTQSRCLHHWS